MKYYYSNTTRIPPILALADKGWVIEKTVNQNQKLGVRGVCGYDPDDSDMWAIFVANGPQFQVNTTIPQISSLDIYSLLSHLLSITPSPNNGTLHILSGSLL
jgi:ectonucleotide pyrophosphatase/phosphodiesterase family protein 5